MKIEVLTIEDLQAFRAQLLNDIKELLSKKTNERNLMPLIKSNEVRKLLSISPGTLHNLSIPMMVTPHSDDGNPPLRGTNK